VLTVVCWLWRDDTYRFNKLFRYGPEHVNTLRAMVRRNLTLEHEFVCITDDPEGIEKDIRIIPIWDDLKEMGGCYRRLKAFSPEMSGVIGKRFVWIDVDCVVTGPLDPLFDHADPFRIWANGYGRTPYCGSMVMMDAGARKEVWEEFDPVTSMEQARARQFIGTDQAWISARLPGERVWTREDGVLSRYDLGVRDSKLAGRARRLGMSAPLPDDARIVFFHGPFDPAHPDLQARCPWLADHYRKD
jgi:hypothetical protein